jgi:hypothetical protein
MWSISDIVKIFVTVKVLNQSVVFFRESIRINKFQSIFLLISHRYYQLFAIIKLLFYILSYILRNHMIVIS